MHPIFTRVHFLPLDKSEEDNMMSHLKLNDRITIQEGLDNRYSLNTIAKNVGKSTSTISREICKRRHYIGKRRPDLPDPCKNKKTCDVYHLCQDIRCKSPCRTCNKCVTLCKNYVPATCDKLSKSPYVCNACTKANVCPNTRYLYVATYAQDMYENTLIESREGIDISQEELNKLDKLVSPLLIKGQSIEHIFNTHKDEINVCKKTLYNYVERQILSARNIDLPRKVKYKRRKHTTKMSLETKMSVLSRNYERFNEYIRDNPESSIVEMDTVIGTIASKKVLLTLLFRSCNLMLIILLEEKSQDCVINALNDICEAVGIEIFKKLFGVIITDRGTEFLYPEALECDMYGEIKTKVFYCDPQASWQKAQIERNHEFIRYILPKGRTFDNLTQEDINLVRDHINSYSRPQYNGASPYQLSKLLLDNTLHKALNLKEIAADDIILKPSLLFNKEKHIDKIDL